MKRSSRCVAFPVLLSILGILGGLIAPNRVLSQPMIDYGLSTSFDTSDPGQTRYVVTIRLSATDNASDLGLGQADFYLNYNTAGLDFANAPVYNTDWKLAPAIESNANCYGSSGVFDQEAQGRVYVSIDYNYTGFACGTDNGLVLDNSFQDIVTLTFDITNENETAGLTWEQSITNVFADDDTSTPTQFSNNSFEENDTLLPVELVAFDAILDAEKAVLKWSTASETNNAGFEVQHRVGQVVVATDEEDLPSTAASWEVLGFVEGAGTTLAVQDYVFRTDALEIGLHAFRLRQVDYDGEFEYSPEVEVTVEMVERYVLEPAYPNPLKPIATIRFAVREAQSVHMELYNVLGQRVKVLYAGDIEGSRMQEVRIDGSDLSSGVYLVQLRGEDFREIQKIVLVK